MRTGGLLRASAMAAGSGMLLSVVASPASAVIVMLGDQDFADGQILAGVAQFNGASAGEPVPFDQFYGSDFTTNFSQPFTFNYGAGAVSGATLTLGIWDHDSQAPGNQVASFTVDGFDLTAQLNAAFESRGGAQSEVNVYTLPLPAGALALLADGQANFSLTLQGPGLQAGGATTAANGAGLDFATLNATQVPEPSLAIGAIAAGSVVAAVRRGRGRRRT
jgi:hypothetical protein